MQGENPHFAHQNVCTLARYSSTNNRGFWFLSFEGYYFVSSILSKIALEFILCCCGPVALQLWRVCDRAGFWRPQPSRRFFSADGPSPTWKSHHVSPSFCHGSELFLGRVQRSSRAMMMLLVLSGPPVWRSHSNFDIVAHTASAAHLTGCDMRTSYKSWS